MEKKQFQTESKKLLDMMINSIYTHKEIFLRELISNASDAIDKRYFKSLTDSDSGLPRSEYEISLAADEEARTLTVSDNGCGMTPEELENNLGTIAKSGSLDFKSENSAENVDIIGQFGVGFYSAFMVADKVTVVSKVYGAEKAWKWESEGVDGYTLEECEKESVGTEITLHIKPDSEEEDYCEFLEPYSIQRLVKKYSDYIHYPIRMDFEVNKPVEGKEGETEKVTERRTLNSITPLWKKPAAEVTEEEYNNFYTSKFMDYEPPIKVMHYRQEGVVEYTALLYIPSHAPFDYYSKNYEKGLQLYSSGVMIMDRCAEMLPDYFSFVKGLIDSSDISLNISRETLQQDHQLRTIAKAVEKKIKSELLKLLENDREKYEKFYKAFGSQLKFGVYSDYGTHKEQLQDLIMFISSNEMKYTTLKEYAARMPEGQKSIYYACGDTPEKALRLPQAAAVKAKGYEILLLTEDVDEFTLQTLMSFEDKKFVNVSTDELDLNTEEETKKLAEENESGKELLDFIKESVGGLNSVKFSNALGGHPAALSSEGGMTIEMARVLSKMPDAGEGLKASLVLELNSEHPVTAKIKELYGSDKEKCAKYCKLLYAQARLLSGLEIEDAEELSGLISELMV